MQGEYGDIRHTKTHRKRQTGTGTGDRDTDTDHIKYSRIGGGRHVAYDIHTHTHSD